MTKRPRTTELCFLDTGILRHIFDFASDSFMAESTLRLVTSKWRKTFLRSPGYRDLGFPATTPMTNELLQRVLRAYPSLHQLCLNRRGTFTNIGWVSLSEHTKLRHLDLSCCYNINDACLQTLSLMHGLESLTLAKSKFVQDEGIRSLITLTNLRTLNLEKCIGLTDACLVHFVTFTKLVTLNLAGCIKLTGFGTRSLATLSTLESLNLNLCAKMNDEGAVPLSRLTRLRQLYLKYSSISDLGLEKLEALSNLEELIADHCDDFDDKGLEHVGTLRRLRCLSLSYCQKITDVGVWSLATLTNLEKLYVNGCHLLTDESLDSLSKSNTSLICLGADDIHFSENSCTTFKSLLPTCFFSNNIEQFEYTLPLDDDMGPWYDEQEFVSGGMFYPDLVVESEMVVLETRLVELERRSEEELEEEEEEEVEEEEEEEVEKEVE
jgi:hypothetical protein